MAQSCMISTAVDGDVAFFTESQDFEPRTPCQVRIVGRTLLISQRGREFVRVDDVSAARLDEVLQAPNLMVVNILGAGGPGEVMSINKEVALVR